MKNTPYSVSILTLRYLLAASLLAYYLVPRTIWSQCSPLNKFLAFDVGCASTSCILAVSAFCGVTWILYRRVAHGANPTHHLWLLILLYVGAYVGTALIGQANLAIVNNCLLVASATSTGLLAVYVCNRDVTACHVICFLGILQALYTIYYHVTGQNVLISGELARAGGTLHNPNGVNTVMIVCLPMVATFALSTEKPRVEFMWSLAASLILAALVLTWGRGGMFSVCIAMTWLIYQLLNHSKIATTITAIAFLCLLVFVAHKRTDGLVNQRSATDSVQGRYSVINKGFVIFRDNWITGVGIGSLRISEKIKSPQRVYKNDYETMQDPKVLILLLLDEMGIAGAILFCSFIAVIVRVIIGSGDHVLASGISAAWIALFVAGLFDTPFGTANRPVGNALVGALLGATLMLRKRENPPEFVTTRHRNAFDQSHFIEEDT